MQILGSGPHGASMQTMFDSLSPEEIVDNMVYSENKEDGLFDVGIMLKADEGSTISMDEVLALMEERKKTGTPMAKLVQKLKNVSAEIIISPGPGIPEIAKREKNRGSRNEPIESSDNN